LEPWWQKNDAKKYNSMKHSIGFIGGGRVTKILLQGFKNRNVEFSRIVVTDTNSEVLS
jgi:pyrroline-5-carboxylate reductase